VPEAARVAPPAPRRAKLRAEGAAEPCRGSAAAAASAQASTSRARERLVPERRLEEWGDIIGGGAPGDSATSRVPAGGYGTLAPPSVPERTPPFSRTVP